MPLREEGAVAANTMTSTSASASFLLSLSISCTTRSVESASTLLRPMRATCSVNPGGSARQKSASCTEFEEGSSTPIRRNSSRCDLVPNVLAGVETIDIATTVMGQRLALPLFCSPTALQRLFHHDGERAVAKAAEKFGTMFGVSSLGTVSVEEIGAAITTPKMFQLYFHKDRGLTSSMIERCIAANFDVLALTVDTITGGNRERDWRTGFTSPPRLTPASVLSFALHPAWTVNYLAREPFSLPQLEDHVKEGTNVAISVGEYFSTMLDQSMNWRDAEQVRVKWVR